MIRKRILGKYRRYKEKKDHLKKIALVRRNACLLHQGDGVANKSYPVVLCLVKDGMEHLPSFMNHYTEFGCEEFVFVDNGSSDGTLEYLVEKNCTVYKCSLGYEEYIYAMKQFLVHSCGQGRWTLCVDIDELWLYPNCNHIRLPEFIRYLEISNYNACQAHMLDMFGESFQPTNEKLNDLSLKEAYPFFTLEGLVRSPLRRYFIESDGKRLQYHGGANNHFFDLRDIYLSKIPLIKWNHNMIVHESSHISKYIRLADISCALLHYKFTHSFFQKAKKIVENKRDKWAVKYYGKILSSYKGNNRLVDSNSHKFQNTQQLVDLGFIDTSEKYNIYLSKKSDD